ncbi:hypothetical protein NE686_06980 [Tissierella carlieri]|uniref:Uncharacterized protein n=1 Tax=Tissierella carlieri TaxID=689904 RepID=A0ABT1S8M0_9FIRM|nr:hypothetical protein [Tissierella carlieri]MCQ4922820.1 hypothetical protein [Tissierella carlieri]
MKKSIKSIMALALVITILSVSAMSALAASSFSTSTQKNGTLSGETYCGVHGSPNLSYSETRLASPTSSSYIKASHEVVNYSTGATVATPSSDSGYNKSYVSSYVFLRPGKYTSYGTHDFYNGSETISKYTSYVGFIVD